MTALSTSRTPISAAATSLLASLLAGALVGWAVAVPRFDTRYLAGCIVAALAAGGGLAALAAVRPPGALLSLIELLGFAALLLVKSAVAGAPDPLPIAVLVTVVVGVVAVAGRRAKPADVLVALVAGYLSAAVIYEVGIPLHNLL